MEIDVFTLFPDAFAWFERQRHVVNALSQGHRLGYVNYRDHTPLGAGQVDDTPFGGGAGMVLRVDVVESAAAADRALHVVVQEQTVNKRTIGFTASYLTATPCSEEIGGRKVDVELKGTLGTYSNAKGPGLANDLAAMLDQDLQQVRTGATK